DTLPAISRKNHATSGAAPAPAAPAPHQTEPEPARIEAGPEQAQEEAHAAAATNGAPGPMLDDLEIPAILRRRLVQ
ncbi:MAG: hypothetical protein JO307_25585, partial [Bryobacterales bacterium]|nr:hypothetical protein [Bryobacterales bacterium]